LFLELHNYNKIAINGQIQMYDAEKETSGYVFFKRSTRLSPFQRQVRRNTYLAYLLYLWEHHLYSSHKIKSFIAMQSWVWPGHCCDLSSPSRTSEHPLKKSWSAGYTVFGFLFSSLVNIGFSNQ